MAKLLVFFFSIFFKYFLGVIRIVFKIVGISKNEDVIINFFEMPTLHRRNIKHNNEPSNNMKKIQEGLYLFFLQNFPSL
jgi:uncharacterized membrane protein